MSVSPHKCVRPVFDVTAAIEVGFNIRVGSATCGGLEAQGARAFSKGALQPAPSSSGASSAAKGLVGDPGANPAPAAASPPADRGDAESAWHSAAAFAAPSAAPTATSASSLAARACQRYK